MTWGISLFLTLVDFVLYGTRGRTEAPADEVIRERRY